MTITEFNQKWSNHLEEGHYGLSIDLKEVIEFLDLNFKLLEEEYPEFTYSQIKIKWASANVYLSNASKEWADKLEEGIEEILWRLEN